MKTLYPFAAALLVLLTLSCKKDGPPPTQLDMIAGDGQKVWRYTAALIRMRDTTFYQQGEYHPDSAHSTETYFRSGKVYSDTWENGRIVEAYRYVADWEFDRDGQEIVFTGPVGETRVKVEKLTPDSLIWYDPAAPSFGYVYVPK